jgi:hypothetical protein
MCPGYGRKFFVPRERVQPDFNALVIDSFENVPLYCARFGAGYQEEHNT